ncbi:FAD/NAD(P)-binding domain-containing protein [Mycena albidolilacea]|uniref:FAD/NAD(P)-binding domain-containing protein n=1 Tax=Mycena albidolilacea TaxID=1033008 RepID=A0AAD7AJ50_9AGAR|nr:FAD/NAD(P)-binding domain-containing protein [Mycena albidolilacea]
MTSSNNSYQPLNISIVGAGIGGLTAAIALRKNGHNVQIFETAEIKTEIGAAVAVQANSLRVLDHLGVSKENLKGFLSVFLGSWLIRFAFKIYKGWPPQISNLALKTAGLLCHRSDLYEELKRLATGEGEGPPALLRLGTTVVASDPEQGAVTLKGGEIVDADCILGADGIHSIIRSQILGNTVKAENSGWSCFRVIFEVSNLLNTPELEWLHAGVTGSRIVIDREGPFRMFLIYPCRNGAFINVVAFYPDSPEDDAGDPILIPFPVVWMPTTTREEFIAKFPKFHPKFLSFLDLPTHDSIHRWKLRVLPHLPTWVRGRAALLGDAAHGTLPLLGQGAGMAVEDGGSLGFLLPAGTRREDIPARLEAHQRLRTERGEFVNTESVAQLSKGFNLLEAKKIQSHLPEYDAMEAAEKATATI